MQYAQGAKNGPDTCLLDIAELLNLPNHGLVTSIAAFLESRKHDGRDADPKRGSDHLYSLVPNCGEDLKTWAHRFDNDIVPENECRVIFWQLLDILTYLKGRNLCHRDICHQNLVWDPVRSHLTLIDLAQLAWPGEDPDPATRIAEGKFMIPKPEVIVGKIAFRAPELCDTSVAQYDGFAIDLWQSVEVLWIMRTGNFLYGLRDYITEYVWSTENEANLCFLASYYLGPMQTEMRVVELAFSDGETDRRMQKYYPWDYASVSRPLDPTGWFQFLCCCPPDVYASEGHYKRWAMFCYKVNYTYGGRTHYNHNVHYLKLNFLELIADSTRKDQSARLTLEQIRQHPWMAGVVSSTVGEGEWNEEFEASNPNSGNTKLLPVQAAQPQPMDVDHAEATPRGERTAEIDDLYPSPPPPSLDEGWEPPPMDE
ncbi:hypothetical protein TrLO_g8179 [Triparma laevis f. longispina]|uniref:Protein kinase domain-containing protein n=1 Tax=Triparma laevis f. longispina TaxID=1714387 RepID=A0A9W6Z9K4_9STRA|nr:hypothetical protein TrLO_g8179 [Triparma laevis f. longispina]